MRKLTYILALNFMMGHAVYAQETISQDSRKFIAEIMVTSKMTGMCGLMSQMARFQETTKMEGGSEFVLRFLSTETARLGLTLEEFMAQCDVVYKNYAAFSKDYGLPL